MAAAAVSAAAVPEAASAAEAVAAASADAADMRAARDGKLRFRLLHPWVSSGAATGCGSPYIKAAAADSIYAGSRTAVTGKRRIRLC